MDQNCPYCLKPYYDAHNLTVAQETCTCHALRILPTEPTQLYGWECLRCHLIHAPFILSCNCSPPFPTDISSTGTGATHRA